MQALKLAIEIKGLHLVSRVLVNLGRIYQQNGNEELAIEIWKACLLHSATDQDSREKAQKWLAKLGIVIDEEMNNSWMNELLTHHLLVNDLSHSK